MPARTPSTEAFRTYRNYISAWWAAVDAIGTPAIPPNAPTQAQLSEAVENELVRALNRAWGNLRALEILNLDGLAAEVLPVHPPIAYYAIHHTLRALLLALQNQASNSHGGVLTKASELCANNQVPAPWSSTCTGIPGDRALTAFNAYTWPSSNLSAITNVNAEGFRAMSLTTTRRDVVEETLTQTRKKHNGRLPNGERAKKYQTFRAITVFDVFYRYRRIAHYGNVDDFTAFPTAEEAHRFGSDLFRLSDATCRMAEGLIVRKVGSAKFEDWLDEYMEHHSIDLLEGPVGRRRHDLDAPF